MSVIRHTNKYINETAIFHENQIYFINSQMINRYITRNFIVIVINAGNKIISSKYPRTGIKS